MRLQDYDAALEREAVGYPDRAEEIAAERARIAPAVALELAAEGVPGWVADLGDVDALVTEALAELDEAKGVKA